MSQEGPGIDTKETLFSPQNTKADQCETEGLLKDNQASFFKR